MSWKTELALTLEDPPNLFCAVTLGAFCFFVFLSFGFDVLDLRFWLIGFALGFLCCV